MASDYYPIYASLWNDEKLEGASFEEHGFFAYLCSNTRLRPSGIYRVTDAQLVADTALSPTKVRSYCADLDGRGLIVRDGAGIFVCAYFKRQPKSENLLKGVASDIATCSSVRILESFSLKYPLRSQWSTDRLSTLHRLTASSGLQCSAVQLQSSAVQSNMSGDAPDAMALGKDLDGHDHGPAAMRTAARDLLAYLNKKAGKHFQPTPTNLDLITARLREGATVLHCRAIIGMKTAEWKGDAKMGKYLRPETLFDRIHFASYQGELPATAFEGPRDA